MGCLQRHLVGSSDNCFLFFLFFFVKECLLVIFFLKKERKFWLNTIKFLAVQEVLLTKEQGSVILGKLNVMSGPDTVIRHNNFFAIQVLIL